MPELPMYMLKPLVQVEPAPSTVTVPMEPVSEPTLAAVLPLTLPPLAISSEPLPDSPTKR